MEIFNIHLEFNREKLYKGIESRISEKKAGYICVCDSSVLARAHRDLVYRRIVNNSFLNTCDGSLICTMANKLYGPGLESINGPELFARYVSTPYKQVIIGNTEHIIQKVHEKLIEANIDDSHIVHLQVPFCKVDDFDYLEIAKTINEGEYDIIWVSLGNPKQEIFMNKLLPYLKQGVLFGIGAALNFWVGELSLPKFHIGNLRFIWLTRIFQDPVRQIRVNWQIIKDLPAMFKEEKTKAIQRKEHV